MTIDIQDVKVKIKLLKDAGKTLAQVDLILFDGWTEHGWRVMTSEHLNPILQEHIWIQSPCFRIGSTWKEMVFVDDKKLYEKLQEKIYDSYHLSKIKQDQEQNSASFENGEPIEEIPF